LRAELTKGAAIMAKLQVVERTSEPAAEAPVPLTGARARLADAIGQRAPLTAETEAIEAAQRRLSSLIVAEKTAADMVASLEARAWRDVTESGFPNQGRFA
jgi:hypothetical protein